MFLQKENLPAQDDLARRHLLVQLVHVFGEFHIHSHLRNGRVPRQPITGGLAGTATRPRAASSGGAGIAPRRENPAPPGPPPYLILGLVVWDGEAVGDLHRVFVHGPCGREGGRKGGQRVRGAPRGERALSPRLRRVGQGGQSGGSHPAASR